MLQSRNCQFKSDYEDNEKGGTATYSCPHDALKDSNFCLFHDGNYVTNRSEKEQVLDRLNDLVTQSIDEKKSLFCIGFIIPSLTAIRKFPGNVYFNKAKFIGKADFTGAQFLGKADFTGAQFIYGNFGNAVFKEQTSFSDAKFEGCHFSRCKFLREALFFYCESKEAIFNGVEFLDDVFFNDSDFQGTSMFSNLNVKGRLDFEDATFTDLSLTRSSFCGEVNFAGTEIARCFINHLIFSNRVLFIHTQFKSMTVFNFITFGKEHEALFDIPTLSNISLVNTDITRVKFSEAAIWGTLKEPFKIQSERILEKSISEQDGKGYKKDTNLVIAGIENINLAMAGIENINLAMAGIENLNELLTMYRNLRENYEFRMKYDEAGQFFVREMEVRRKYRQGKSGILKNNWVRRNFSLTGIYHILSNYGEDFRIPIGWLLSLSVLITISSVYLKSGPLTSESLTPLWQSAQITISDLLQMNSNPGFLDYIVRIISIPILGLVFISLRRKFERKFRH